MQMFTLGKNHNDIPEEHMSKHFSLLIFFPTRSLQEFSESLVMSRCNSLSSAHSVTGAPQSITEWLALWEKDPVEILLDLGFGTEEPDVCTKIPPRFLSGASVAKGINIRVFLEAQKQRMYIEQPNLYGRFRQLEVLDHVTSALSSLLTNVNTQQTMAQDTGRVETDLLGAAKTRAVVTQAKRRRIGQLLRQASRQTALLKQGSLAPGEVHLPGMKEQPPPCADTAERGTIQAGFSAHVTLGSLTPEQTSRDKGSSAYPVSQCPPALPGKTWASSHLVTKQPHLSSACEVPAKDRPRRETHLLLAHTLKKAAGLHCKPPDSFEMEEIQSFDDEIPCGNAPDTTSEVMVTRTSSCQSDSSGFMEELPEPLVLQNASLSGKMSIISDNYNEGTALSHRTEFPMLNQDFQQNPDDCVTEVFITAYESILTVSKPTKACSDRGEEICLLLTAENGDYQTRNADLQTYVQERLHDMDKKEHKTGRKQLEEEECMKQYTPCFKSDTQDEGDPISSKFVHQFCFSTGHKNTNIVFTELSDTNHAVISESKHRGNDEGERCLTEKHVGFAYHENAHGSSIEHVKGLWWGQEVVGKDGTLLAVNEETNRQMLCNMDSNAKNTRYFSERGLPETLCQGTAVQSGSSATSSRSPQVSCSPPCCLAEGPGLSSPEDQQTGSIREMLGADKPEQAGTVQNCEMTRTPLKSVTVQMPSGLEFTSRVKCKGQNAPRIESLAKDDPMDLSSVLAHSEGGRLVWSDPGASKDGVKQTAESSSQTDTLNRKTRLSPLLCPPHSHLIKSSSLDSILFGKYRSHHWDETSGITGAQGSHCCHCCCCHSCCSGTYPVPVSPHRPVGCCSNHTTTKLHLLKTLTLLQETAMRNLPPCTLQEIELMKISCQHFRDKLDEIEQHLTEQQALLSDVMPDEGREESRNLQLLRQAVHQEVAELEFQLNDQTCQVRDGILMQLDQLLVEQSHLFSELGLSDWKGERNAQNKQALPDAADTVHPRSGCSKMVLQRAPSKNITAAGSLSALQQGAPLAPFSTKTVPEPNSDESDPQEPSTSKKEIKGPPQAKMDFKTFIRNLKKSFRSPLGNDSEEGKD
ncbi:protein ITPRID1 isoform X1 [Anser cygnoides]|uniref:protein ITPRID1 isoform X1 n=2 Tax=Anser cygnoides TaxID=8845 RepID=UPI0034D34D1A